MSDKVYQVLFICTGNSARSIMAEGLLNHLGQGRFVAHSAGSHPKGEVHPLALQTMQTLGLPTTGFQSKSWEAFSGPAAVPLDFVFTVCDNAAGEVCPVWPGQPVTAHWGVADPAAVTGSEAQCLRAFMDAAVVLKRRIELMLALPIDRLDALGLQQRVREIGTQ